ncbi:hypothetical protein JST99_02205 [Candidatus Dependentiae bacterium]|nr:hypothetical protein [Candidatus Dependentiae bacterium]
MKTIQYGISMVICLTTATIGYTQNLNYVQKLSPSREFAHHDQIDLLSAPITMTSAGINSFLSTIYNNPRYAQTILPHSFLHLTQLLEHGHKTLLSRSYVQSTIRLFANKMKACPYISASAFNSLLSSLPDLLKPYFAKPETYAIDRLKKRINNILYAQFLEQFTTFKQDPDYFFKDLSHMIAHEVEADNAQQDIISSEEMRKTILVFLEVGIAKLMWNPTQTKDGWSTMKSLSESMTTLLEYSILADVDDLNDLFVSLIERYCYFIDVSATDLPLDFYNTVSKEIATLSLPLLDLEEQEEYIEPKKQRLLRSLAHGQARCAAYNHKAHVTLPVQS